MWSVWLQGLGMGASLIVVIGAQNAFVLAQGIRGRHRLVVALTCALCDALLIALGVAGVGTLITAQPTLLNLAAWGGALFLIGYGWRSLKHALKPHQLEADGSRQGPATARAALMTTLALSLLNPHVYLDTVVLLGSLSAQHGQPGNIWFGFGAMTASFAWFFGLCFGARWLSPLFQKPVSWRLLDGFTCAVMWLIAASLFTQGAARLPALGA